MICLFSLDPLYVYLCVEFLVLIYGNGIGEALQIDNNVLKKLFSSVQFLAQLGCITYSNQLPKPTNVRREEWDCPRLVLCASKKHKQIYKGKRKTA